MAVRCRIQATILSRTGSTRPGAFTMANLIDDELYTALGQFAAGVRIFVLSRQLPQRHCFAGGEICRARHETSPSANDAARYRAARLHGARRVLRQVAAGTGQGSGLNHAGDRTFDFRMSGQSDQLGRRSERIDEYAYEYRDGVTSYGAFTYFHQSVIRCGTSKKSFKFQELIDQVADRIAVYYQQTPQLVGPKAWRRAFIPWRASRSSVPAGGKNKGRKK
jgi:hypothetical protein